MSLSKQATDMALSSQAFILRSLLIHVGLLGDICYITRKKHKKKTQDTIHMYRMMVHYMGTNNAPIAGRIMDQ